MAFSEHLTVESYTVFICQQSYLLLFLSRLKTSLLYKSFPLQPFLSFYSNIYYMDSPDCLQLFLGISVFYFQFLFLFLHFLVVGSVRQIKLTHVGFRAYVIIASRIVSYYRCSAPAVWNSLPKTVVNSASVTVFKSRLKTFLFSRAFSLPSSHQHTAWPQRL